MILPVTALVCFAFLYQLVALPLYTFDGIGPDFVLAAACALSVHGRPGVALVTALGCGVIVDFLSLDPWSAHALGYLAASWMLVRARGRRWIKDVPSLTVLIIVASMAATAVRYSILFIDEGGTVLPTWTGGALEALYSGAISCVVTGAVGPFRRALAGPRRRSEFHQTATTD